MSHAIDHAKARIEYMRWVILLCLMEARPNTCMETLIHVAVRGVIENTRAEEIRSELDFLHRGGFLIIHSDEQTPYWRVELTFKGINYAQWNAPAESGIARPRKYF